MDRLRLEIEIKEIIMSVAQNAVIKEKTFYISMHQGEMIEVELFDSRLTLKYGDSPMITIYSIDQFLALMQILNQI